MTCPELSFDGYYIGTLAFSTGTNRSKGITPKDFKNTDWKKYRKKSLNRDNHIVLSDSSNYQLNARSGNDYLILDDSSSCTINAGKGDDTIEIRNFVSGELTLGAGKDVVTGIGNSGVVTVKDYSVKDDIIKSEAKIEWHNRDSDNSIVLMQVPNFETAFGQATLTSGAVVLEGVTNIESVIFDGDPHLIEVEGSHV